ncbi:glutathione peroxidase [Listeria monocytogenes]|nr:glutathione peroxidase [Listeria monocytogenes]GAT37879.1 glutathione peroxidase [Listeria monocytogenes]GAT40108.1 glutathione peroxidase [Listeria monocytogenes]
MGNVQQLLHFHQLRISQSSILLFYHPFVRLNIYKVGWHLCLLL